MTVRLIGVLVLFAGIIQSGFSQTISFNTPLPWVSLRNDTITVRAQIDTAASKGKTLSLSLLSVKNGKIGTIASKSFRITDPSGEFTFGKIRKKLVGGEEFIRIAWVVKGAKLKGAKEKSAEEKGTIEPIGIADLTGLANADTVAAIKIADDKTSKDAAVAIGNKLSKIGTVAYGVAWNKTGLFIAVKKSAGKETVKFNFDGKTGKNAFMSYPDRVVVCSLGDTLAVKGVHFQREISNNALSYKEEKWRDEITYEVVGDVVVVRVPWFDTGMIPFEGRTIGFGAFVENAKGKSVASMPKNGEFFIPATWGILLLQK